MASKTVRMKHDNGDVKVIPAELEKQFRERGWKQDAGAKSKPAESK